MPTRRIIIKSIGSIELLIAIVFLCLSGYILLNTGNCVVRAHDCPGLALLVPILLGPPGILLFISSICLFKYNSWYSQVLATFAIFWIIGWMLFLTYYT